MKNILNTFVAVAAILGIISAGESSTMDNKVKRFLSQIQENRPDKKEVISTAIRDFSDRRNNFSDRRNRIILLKILDDYKGLNEQIAQSEQFIKFIGELKSGNSLNALLTPDTYGALRNELYSIIKDMQDRGEFGELRGEVDNLLKALDPANPEEQFQVLEMNSKLKEIIDRDKVNELQEYIDKLQEYISDQKTFNTLTMQFKDEPKMSVPLIQYCIMKNAIKCFKYLLVNGYDDPNRTIEILHSFTMQWGDEWDSMATAIYFGNKPIIEILKDKGIELGSTPAHIEAAILSYRNEILEAIEDSGWNQEAIKTKAIFAAARSNNILAAELLFSKGANVNAEDGLGRAPLHYAACNNSKEIGELLISKGADINTKDKMGKTPLYYAQHNNGMLSPLEYNANKYMIELLISKGAHQ